MWPHRDRRIEPTAPEGLVHVDVEKIGMIQMVAAEKLTADR
ncbi:UNVERIFIED_ORG: hypothetical protein L601_005700000130 [Gordonia westfalica J30]